MRHRASPKLGRAVAVSDDGGDTFGPITYDAALVSPVCQASIVSFGGSTFFSNPASTSGRNHLTIRKSTDNAITCAASRPAARPPRDRCVTAARPPRDRRVTAA